MGGRSLWPNERRRFGADVDADADADGRNVVGTVDLKTPLDLKTIALHARNAEYNPKVRRGKCKKKLKADKSDALVAGTQRFSAVIMRLRDPKTTALIFGSGKVRPCYLDLVMSEREKKS